MYMQMYKFSDLCGCARVGITERETFDDLRLKASFQRSISRSNVTGWNKNRVSVVSNSDAHFQLKSPNECYQVKTPHRFNAATNN